jgi:hypothetical protein
VELSPLLEINSHSSVLEILSFIEPKIHYHAHKGMAVHPILTWSILIYPVSLGILLILIFHLWLCRSSIHFPSCILTKILYAFPSLPAFCIISRLILNLITLIIEKLITFAGSMSALFHHSSCTPS